MKEQKQHFEDYLVSQGYEQIPHLIGVFEHYQKLLGDANKVVNLISRKMQVENYWVQHFLDSLLVNEIVDFEGQTVLDFGTGGGLPGIPIKIVQENCEMILLDSTQKKCRAVQEMVEALSLSNTGVVCARVEDYAFMARRPSFDLILCRAVALEERYVAPLRRLLKPSGRLLMYKSRALDDLDGIKYELLLEKEDEHIGLRRLIGIHQRDLMKR
ncbi:MAG: 16S rRNA (guanine(527)-N(7))-methyltransferase RsmG [Candidatus Cloacimonetes bacterium]|jgi:16S rRNA (guanine527-N7)-methyltransferase|nr:16S rRNA (guanine(527)-N(7))-methyltransferase RsmG [Candidatus Cloacimonadota bacterium]MDD4100932.1 16S rRNA (guanine(527)-N(7))-methyltransferase RsmG [Candidatus Cloacimonadota bacterium]MDD4806440.1 16S rRNA (guanine(527)-N(7))-methyltransferase RsmG [Candidatus Cloacimonadota bacterium]